MWNLSLYWCRKSVTFLHNSFEHWKTQAWKVNSYIIFNLSYFLAHLRQNSKLSLSKSQTSWLINSKNINLKSNLTSSRIEIVEAVHVCVHEDVTTSNKKTQVYFTHRLKSSWLLLFLVVFRNKSPCIKPCILIGIIVLPKTFIFFMII